ncbi:MAG: DEAD/DEAH box helicase family protein, partial [Gammaproteobacteria bacterium]|nr:DEAD/DEAH box helicase family protein [Gammaproteobacteria bacterium]
FWMATGSGKTLIMHLNYHQFLNYSKAAPDNILLITPNEGLSEQHLREFSLSGIPAKRFALNESGLLLARQNTVRVLEITKLAEKKRGSGERVPVDAFVGNNLIFVDEGHKGSGGQAWLKLRNVLGETGFTFEYSATFGQALTATRKDALTREYGKAIVFDYSYRYFYDDGYGKDFRILNLTDETTEETTDLLLLGNLLSFYQQKRVFVEQASTLRPYNLEKPLWVFVGSTVNAVYTKDKRARSDVLVVTRFLHRVLTDRHWATGAMGKLLSGNSGLVAPNGEDVFKGKFDNLQGSGMDCPQIYDDILSKVFHAPGGGGLHLCSIRNCKGEIGLKAGSAEVYFGLIYIGDVGKFKKLVAQDAADIALEEDAMADSLFNNIAARDTCIDVLIGAKKFMEGWNSWRVSNMGLLNIGRKEGSEIIQLFGRGVRLQGWEQSLKRSSALDGEHPDDLKLLETLNIFALRANYMAQFRDYLEREGIATAGFRKWDLPIRPNSEFLGKGLVAPRPPAGRHFADEENVFLQIDEAAQVRLDMSTKVHILQSEATGVKEAEFQSGQDRPVPESSLALLDWQEIYLDLLEYKEQKGLNNFALMPETAREIMSSADPVPLYVLQADDAIVHPRTYNGVVRLQEIVVSILRKYMDRYYRVLRERWDAENMVYTEIDEQDENFQDYRIRVRDDETELITAIENLLQEGEDIYCTETSDIPNVYFDRHLYQPLLIEKGSRVESTPERLTASEERFVRDLKSYCSLHKGGFLADKEIYLLRNLSRGKGIGFFENTGFFPDFILWIKDASGQRIVFIEPHGMLYAPSYEQDEKAKLHERLPEFAEKISRRSKVTNVALDSFIISRTPHTDLWDRYGDVPWDVQQFAQAHILFPEQNGEYGYIRTIMEPEETALTQE